MAELNMIDVVDHEYIDKLVAIMRNAELTRVRIARKGLALYQIRQQPFFGGNYTPELSTFKWRATIKCDDGERVVYGQHRYTT